MEILFCIQSNAGYLSGLTFNGKSVLEQYRNSKNENFTMQTEESECNICVSFSKINHKELKKKIYYSFLQGLFGIIDYTINDAVNDTKIVQTSIDILLNDGENLLKIDSTGHIIYSTVYVKKVMQKKEYDYKLLQVTKRYFFIPIAILTLIFTGIFGVCGYCAILSNNYFSGIFAWMILLILNIFVVVAYIRKFK